MGERPPPTRVAASPVHEALASDLQNQPKASQNGARDHAAAYGSGDNQRANGCARSYEEAETGCAQTCADAVGVKLHSPTVAAQDQHEAANAYHLRPDCSEGALAHQALASDLQCHLKANQTGVRDHMAACGNGGNLDPRRLALVGLMTVAGPMFEGNRQARRSVGGPGQHDATKDSTVDWKAACEHGQERPPELSPAPEEREPKPVTLRGEDAKLGPPRFIFT